MNKKVVLITGSSRGIGKVIAMDFAMQGHAVIINYLKSKKDAENLRKKIKEINGDVLLIKADVASKNEVKKMVKKIRKEYSHIDYLINNAGVVDSSSKWEEICERDFHRIMAVNTYGVLNVSQEIAPIMKNGIIINIASLRGLLEAKDIMSYAAAKAGVINLTKSLAKVLAPNIRVNCIAFGRMNVGLGKVDGKDKYQKLIKKNLLMRLGEPKDITGVTNFLVSKSASFITGQTIVVDGGASLLE